MIRVLALSLLAALAPLSAYAENGPPGIHTPGTVPDVAAPPAPAPTALEQPARYSLDTKIIPLPIFSTLPQEGNTYGFMPVFLVVEKEIQRTRAIIAPSISWNRIIRFTHTFRLYYYPDNETTINFVPSYSLNTNRGGSLEYFVLPRQQGRWTLETAVRGKRSIFYRFFGLGPETHARDEASYTRIAADISARPGYNISKHFNVGPSVSVNRQIIEQKGVTFLPLATERFRGTPGFNGATTVGEGLSIRYDTRPEYQYSLRGFSTELFGGVAHGLAGTDTFSRVSWETKLLWPELSFVQGGARAYWGYTGGSNVPFYYQQTLGGSNRLRGFTEDRFIDKGAWEIEIEQRIRFLSTRIYGVTTDWRVDPFVALGQVYHGTGDMFKHVRLAGGLGFRAFVRPNVVGRVDVAVAGEGIKTYVELGYPF